MLLSREQRIDLALLQRKVLGHIDNSEYTEIRIPQKGIQKFVRTQQEFKDEISKHIDGHCYVGINPRVQPSGLANAVKDITCVVFDFDPIRPRGTPSSDVQLDDAIKVGRRITNSVSYLVSSGSGSHVYFPIARTTITPEQTAKYEGWYREEKKKHESPTIKADSIFDAPRIIRVWGSFNETSQRYCLPIQYPDKDMAGVRDMEPWASFVVKREEAKLNLTAAEARFHRLRITNPSLDRIMREEARFPSRSEADYAFVSILVKAHFTVQDIKSLIRLNPMGKALEPGFDSGRDVERIVDTVKNNGMDSNSLIHHNTNYFSSLTKRKIGILTGFKTLDEMISGLKPQKVYIMAARPTEGKTTFITQLLTNVAEAGNVCLMFPTEVGAEPIYDKIVSRKTNISLRKFQNGTFEPLDKVAIDKVKDGVSKIPLIVHEDFGLTAETIDRVIREVAPDVVAIDFIQAFKYKEPGSPSEMGGAMRAIKEMAGDYNVPIILASQLNRSDGEANLKQLKGSGSLEELADVVAFLYTLEKTVYPRRTELNVMKSKYSETGSIPLAFYSTTCRFEEVGFNGG